jgi:hypothetical protein
MDPYLSISQKQKSETKNKEKSKGVKNYDKTNIHFASKSY